MSEAGQNEESWVDEGDLTLPDDLLLDGDASPEPVHGDEWPLWPEEAE